MNAAIAMTAQEQTDRRLDLLRRFMLAGLANPDRFADIPREATLFLLPDDDPVFTEAELRSAYDAARRGANVYALHIRSRELPD